MGWSKAKNLKLNTCYLVLKIPLSLHQQVTLLHVDLPAPGLRYIYVSSFLLPHSSFHLSLSLPHFSITLENFIFPSSVLQNNGLCPVSTPQHGSEPTFENRAQLNLALAQSLKCRSGWLITSFLSQTHTLGSIIISPLVS